MSAEHTHLMSREEWRAQFQHVTDPLDLWLCAAVVKQRDAIMAMLEAERPPEDVFEYARSLSNPATNPQGSCR